jgi:ribonucleoside-diphosphate reductase alpha chain
MNGDFIVINPYLVKDLKDRNLWDYEMLGKLKYNDGSVKNISEIPQDMKDKYKEVFEIDPKWLIRTAAYRGKWIDQSQSLNIYYSGTSGKDLAAIYEYGWKMGLKTTYYLRTLGASQVEKSTVSTAEFGSTHKRDGSGVSSMPVTGITDIKSSEPIVSPISMMNIQQQVVTEVSPVQSVVEKFAQVNPVQKVVYNITKAPEATCDGCQ